MNKSDAMAGNSIIGAPSLKNTACSTYFALIDSVRASTSFTGSEAIIFALSWLAAGHLLMKGEVDGFSHIDDMLTREFWIAATKSGLPDEALVAVWGRTDDAPVNESLRRQVLFVVWDLLQHHADDHWDVVDSIWEYSSTRLVGKEPLCQAYDASLCDLLFDLLRAEPGSSVWIPFDPSGQLIIRAIRRGLKVLAIGPGWNWPSPIVHLLLLLEDANHRPSELVFKLDSDNSNRPVFDVDYLIACPPLGVKVAHRVGWEKWDGRLVGGSYGQFDRSDSWSINAFWPFVLRRAIFMTLPNVLFAKGQEQRLREAMILGSKKVVTVVSLPARLVQGSGLVTALIIMDRAHEKSQLRMVDAAECTTESKSTMRFSRSLDSKRVAELAFKQITEVDFSKDVQFDEIAKQDFNLVPARYLRQVAVGNEIRVSLGELVEAIRAPVASKDINSVTVQEIGIPDLDRWQSIVGPFEKTTAVQASKLANCAVREGDILLSIKGTLGKTGLIGPIPLIAQKTLSNITTEPPRNSKQKEAANYSVVCSQSCVVLRVISDQISAVSLFLYLRSDDFKQQVEALRVGASVAHVTPATLLQDVSVPLVSVSDQGLAHTLHAELCELEMNIDQAYQRINEIRAKL